MTGDPHTLPGPSNRLTIQYLGLNFLDRRIFTGVATSWLKQQATAVKVLRKCEVQSKKKAHTFFRRACLLALPGRLTIVSSLAAGNHPILVYDGLLQGTERPGQREGAGPVCGGHHDVRNLQIFGFKVLGF